jgi:hypothetical protein
VSEDGLSYLIDGYIQGAQGSESTAEAAESTQRALGQVVANAGSWGGAGVADAFVNAVNTTRDIQSRGVAQAAEGRHGMAASDVTIAAIGADTDTAAAQELGSVSAQMQFDQGVADGV